MNRKKCYCSNKFCKCLFGCGCAVYGSVVGKCMCCIMDENDKKLRRRGGNVVIKETGSGEGGECNCDFDGPKFYDIIVFNNVEKEYWSCRYGCLVTISGSFNEGDWKDGKVDKGSKYSSYINIAYEISDINDSEGDILIVKEDNLNHVWCSVQKIPTE